MIAPRRGGELEALTPRRASLAENDLASDSLELERSRDQLAIRKFVSEYGNVDGFDPRSWEQDYFVWTDSERDNGGPTPNQATLRRLMEANADPNEDPSRHGRRCPVTHGVAGLPRSADR